MARRGNRPEPAHWSVVPAESKSCRNNAYNVLPQSAVALSPSPRTTDEAQGWERASIPQLLMPLIGSEDVKKMLNFACTLCYGALL